MSRIIKKFGSPPALGEIFSIDSQQYRLTEIKPYTRRDKRPSFVLRWESHCAECGQPFSITTGLTVRGPNRRCEKHKSALKRVGEKKRRWSGRKTKSQAIN